MKPLVLAVFILSLCVGGFLWVRSRSSDISLPATASLAKPRFHHQWKPNVLQFEKELRGTALEAAMKSRFGHETGPRDPVAAVQIIRAVDGGWSPASDPRKGGAPAGY